MTYVCFFDLLPVELFHTLFNYFLAHEILYTFSDISDHVNAVLLTYCAYRLDLKSIGKSNFHHICRRIRPEQIIYLRLSDDSNTPGLSHRFLTHFPIEQFIQLRSLVLCAIEVTSLESIFSNLHRLDHLCSLSFTSNTIKYISRRQTTDFSKEINRIFSEIRDCFTLIASQLTHLRLKKRVLIKTIQFPNLLLLKLDKCTMKELKTLFLHASFLKSLTICLENEEPNCDFILTSTQFTRLQLTINNTLVSMDVIEQFILKFPNLKHLTLETHGQSDILNGQRYQMLTSNFITFDFKFYVINCFNRNLDSFRTSFWLEEKRWFVASDSHSMFSIPRFSPLEMTLPGQLFIDFTAPDKQIFYGKMTKLTITEIPETIPDCRFMPIKTLNIKCWIPLEILIPIINLNGIEQLSILSIHDISTFNLLISAMPKLYSLSIIKPITADIIEAMHSYQFKQIHNLTIRIDYKNANYIIEGLFRLFPNTKRIACMTYFKSLDGIIRIINGFKHLTHASFYSHCSFSPKDHTYYFDTNLNIPGTRIFTSRIYSLPNHVSKFNINIWLQEQVQCPRNILSIYSSLRRGYHWYRLKYIMFQNFTFNMVLVQAINFFLLEYKNIFKSVVNIEFIPNSFLIPFFCIVLFIISANFTRHFSLITKIYVLTIIVLYYLVYIFTKGVSNTFTLFINKLFNINDSL